MNKREWQEMRCGKKRRFGSREECETSIVENANTTGVPFNAYECGVCGFWHKTHHAQPERLLPTETAKEETR